MTWVSFNKRFRWVPPEKPRVSVVYKAGKQYNVREVCAKEAVKAGAAKRVKAEKDNGETDEDKRRSETQAEFPEARHD